MDFKNRLKYFEEKFSLFNKESYLNIKDLNYQNKYISLIIISTEIKHTIRTLNKLLKINNKKDLICEIKKDIESKIYSLEICSLEDFDNFFENKSLKEIQNELIEYCLGWAKNTI